MSFIDCHAHLPAYSLRCEQRLFINTEKEDQWSQAVKLSASDCHIFLGLHPWYILESSGNTLSVLEDFLYQYPYLGIGEIGLDFGPQRPDKDAQLQLFQKLLNLAVQYNRPVSLHIYKAWQELFNLTRELPEKIPMMIHGFTGSPQQGYQLARKGFYLSLGPRSVQKGPAWLEELLNRVNPDKILTESDYDGIPHGMTPGGYLDILNSVYRSLAERTGESMKKWEERIERNASLFTHRTDDRS